MPTVKDVLRVLSEFAPTNLKMDFDNVGLLVGFSEERVKRILVSLDITDDVIDEAVDKKAQLIVSHHPMFFSVKSVTDMDSTGGKIAALLSHHISAICMHTNLDAAAGGVNDALAGTIGLTDTSLLAVDGFDENGHAFSYGRVGYLTAPVKLKNFLGTVKKCLKSEGLRYHDAGRDVLKVATVAGSGGSQLQHVLAHGCDTLLTSDIKYDVFLEAKEMGINIVDGDHFCTENVVIPVIKNVLETAFPNVTVLVSKRHRQTAMFY